VQAPNGGTPGLSGWQNPPPIAKLRSLENVAVSPLPPLRDIDRGLILRLAAKHGADHVRVFGSVAKGTSGPASDLDLLVRMLPGRSLFDLIALSQDLESALHRAVDVVSEGGLSPYLRDRILDEAIPL
jgi:predicted nucleotidyltransferase